MHDFIAGQVDTLIISMLLGAVLCFGYDIIRCIRRMISHNYFFIALSDLFFGCWQHVSQLQVLTGIIMAASGFTYSLEWL